MSAQNLGVFFIILSCLALCQAQSTRKYECGKNGLKKFDGTVARLVTIANSGRKFPEKKGDQLKQYCDETESLIQDIDLFKSTCTEGLAKQTIGVVVFSLKNGIKQLCKKQSIRLDALLAAAPCLNRNNRKVTKCYEKLIDTMLGVQNADHKKKIPHMCCDYTKFFNCLEDDLVNAPKCNANHIQVFIDFIRSLIGDVVSMMCGEFDNDSDKCVSLGPPPKKLKSQRRTKSYAIPLIDLMASFPQV